MKRKKEKKQKNKIKHEGREGGKKNKTKNGFTETNQKKIQNPLTFKPLSITH